MIHRMRGRTSKYPYITAAPVDTFTKRPHVEALKLEIIFSAKGRSIEPTDLFKMVLEAITIMKPQCKISSSGIDEHQCCCYPKRAIPFIKQFQISVDGIGELKETK